MNTNIYHAAIRSIYFPNSHWLLLLIHSLHRFQSCTRFHPTATDWCLVSVLLNSFVNQSIIEAVARRKRCRIVEFLVIIKSGYLMDSLHPRLFNEILIDRFYSGFSSRRSVDCNPMFSSNIDPSFLAFNCARFKKYLKSARIKDEIELVTAATNGNRDKNLRMHHLDSVSFIAIWKSKDFLMF